MTPLYIFDLDGTLADTSHRVHLLEVPERTPETWDRFFEACDEDAPIWPVIGILNALRRNGSDVWIWTGRSDVVRGKTINWLRRYVCLTTPELLPLQMREAKDHTADDILKRRWLQSLLPSERARLHGVFEDRDRVVKMWREEGVRCFQVAPGAF